MIPADSYQDQFGDSPASARSRARVLVIPILLLLGITALAFLNFVSGLKFQFGFPEELALVAAVTAVVFTLLAAFRSTGVFGQGWVFISLGSLAWAGGISTANDSQTLAPMIDIGFYLISVLAFALAAISFCRVNDDAESHFLRFFKHLPAVVAFSTVVWTLLIGSNVDSFGELSMKQTEVLVRGIGTVIVLTAVSTSLLGGMASGRRWASRVTLAAVGLLSLTESLWNGQSDAHFGMSATTLELICTVCFGLIACSALWIIARGEQQSGAESEKSGRSNTIRADLYQQFGALALLIVLSAVVQIMDQSAPYSELIADVGALVILVFIVARQSLAIRDERILESHIGELSEQLDSLVSQVGRDPLTGLLNHRAVHERLDLELVGGRASGESVAIALIDVDNFKTVNDTLGHQAGDRVLRAVSTILVSACRGTDVAARYAGDEFMLILPGLDERHAGSVCERIAAEVRRLNSDLHLGGGVLVTLSIGVAVTHSCERNVVQNVAIADAAMYDAKESGKNQVVVVNADTLQISPSPSSGPSVDQLMAESRGLFEWERDGVLAG